MQFLRLVFKNLFRHKLRTILTMLGIAIAVMAFNLMRTVVSSWNAGVEASSSARLVTVQSVSFIYPLPLSYRDRIEKLPGVKKVSFANWFGGVYRDKNQFFARFAVDPETYFDVYPEFLVNPDEIAKFKQTPNACIVGIKTAQTYGFKIGDLIPLEGDIYPGSWSMQVVGFYKGREKNIDETAMLFNWKYLDETVKQREPGRDGTVGWYVVDINDPAQRASISASIDGMFANSSAETKTQTEKEFQQSFVSMSGAILTAINVISYIIIGVILLILSNTMVMTARERTREYAVLKTLGFSSGHLTTLIAGEALLISMIGGGLGLALTFPICKGVQEGLPGGWFPVFYVEPATVVFAIATAILAGVASSIFPIVRARQMRIVEGLRQIG